MKLSVCVIGLKCYDQLTGHPIPRYLGGIETQLVVLARALVHSGVDVSMITHDHGQKDGQVVDGVRLFAAAPPEGGVRGIRAFHPRSTALWSAMRRTNASVYLQMGAGAETGQVAAGCRLLGGRLVFCMASDANFSTHLLGFEGRIYEFGLRRATKIIAQTARQQEGLRRATGLLSDIVPMAVTPPPDASARNAGDTRRVLWIGRIVKGKRLEWLLDVARYCPSVSFDVVGTPNRSSDYETGLTQAASKVPNVTLHGRVSAQDLERLYRDATVLACTSELEGFPTTFIESWCRGLPVVTTFDPDDVVARHGLGLVASSVQGFSEKLTGLLADSHRYSGLSDAVIRYYRDHHSPEAIGARFRSLLCEVAATHAA